MAQNALERQLVAGVRAAQQGDKAKARELLEGVLKRDRTNEQAWIWLASVVDTPRERRACIERIIKINPRNTAAQQALNSMVGVLGGNEPTIDYAAMSKAAATPLSTIGNTRAAPKNVPRAAGGGSNRRFLPILIIAAVVLGILFIATFFLPPSIIEPEATAITEVALVAEVSEEPSAIVNPFFTPPSPTIAPSPTFSGTLVTRQADLPATYTPTVTDTPTDTPTATNTLPSVTNYNWLLIAKQGTSLPVLYRVNGTGDGLAPFLANVLEADFDMATGLLVFTEPVEVQVPPTPNPTPDAPISPSQVHIESRMFLVSIGSIDQRTEITNSTMTNAISPSFSPDGSRIAFASDVDGDYEIYIYEVATGNIEQITNNTNVSDRDPDWSPAGSNLVYSSDSSSLGLHKIYNINLLDADPESTITPIVTGSGDNLAAAWSPNGNFIAFRNSDGRGTKLVVTDAAGSFFRELTFQPNQQYSEPSWTSDGLYIVYSAGLENSVHPLYLITPQGGQPRRFDIENLTILHVLQR